MAHRVELTKSTNTGRLVARMLGDRARLVSSDDPSPPGRDIDRDSAWVLFPSEDAIPLDDVAAQVQSLVVPDGTWGQAKRIARRHPRCRDLRRVKLSHPGSSGYGLRRSTLPSALCTLEAIAHALRVIEGDSCADRMLEGFAHWVERAWLVRAGAHNLPVRERTHEDGWA